MACSKRVRGNTFWRLAATIRKRHRGFDQDSRQRFATVEARTSHVAHHFGDWVLVLWIYKREFKLRPGDILVGVCFLGFRRL